MEDTTYFRGAHLLNLLDKTLTFIGVSNGLREVNPFINFFLHHFGVLLGIVLMLAWGAYSISVWSNRFVHGTKIVFYIFLAVVTWNLSLMIFW